MTPTTNQTPTPKLRPYQEAGRAFLRDRKFAILGDAMGLGKTPQYLAALRDVIDAHGAFGRALIIAPAATLPGLAREVQRWTPYIPTVLDHAGKVKAPETGVILLAWTSVSKRAPDLCAGSRFDVVVLDESHRVKDPAAKVTKATLGQWVKGSAETWGRTPSLVDHATRVWAATGTPIPNRPIELQPLLHMAGGLRWAGRKAFGDRYCFQRNVFTPQGFDYKGAINLSELGEKLRSGGVLLRRLPEDVPGELPTLSTSIVPLGVDDAKAVKACGLDPDAIRAATGFGEAVAFEECSEYRREMGEAKVPVAVDWLRAWLEDNPDDALVVFIHHKAVAAALAAALAPHAECFAATGDDAPEARQSMVDAFAAGERRVFIGSIGACGTGLNGLHKRTTVCAFVEAPWTPYELVQAIGRVRRFGSASEHAHAYILVGEDSLEEHILNIVAAKMDTSAHILGDTVSNGSASAVLPAPPAPVAIAPAQSKADDETPDTTPDPAACAWSWAKLKSGAWGIRADTEGSDAWTGATVSVKNRAGVVKDVGVGARAAHGQGWSVYAVLGTPPEVRSRDYLRYRMLGRGLDDAADAAPLSSAADKAAAEVLYAAAQELTAYDRATKRNGEGWDQADGTLGRTLCAIPPAIWTRGTLASARALLRKYARTQVPAVANHI